MSEARSITEVLDAYDFLRKHCKHEEIFLGNTIRQWVDAMALFGGLYVYRPHKMLGGVMFGWPIKEFKDDEEPRMELDGDTFFIRFSFVLGKFVNRQGLKTPRPVQAFAKDILEAKKRFEQLNRVFVMKKKGKEYIPKVFSVVK